MQSRSTLRAHYSRVLSRVNSEDKGTGCAAVTSCVCSRPPRHAYERCTVTVTTDCSCKRANGMPPSFSRCVSSPAKRASAQGQVRWCTSEAASPIQPCCKLIDHTMFLPSPRIAASHARDDLGYIVYVRASVAMCLRPVRLSSSVALSVTFLGRKVSSWKSLTSVPSLFP
jgi:hypothetical protein